MNDEIGMVGGGPGPAERAGPAKKPPSTPNEQVAVAQGQETDKAAKDIAAAKQVAEDIANGLNELVQELHRELRFSVDQDSGDMVVKVIDKDTHEVVRQIPSEELVRLHKRLKEVSGMIFQDSA
jgi:flagellar protein FlaG